MAYLAALMPPSGTTRMRIRARSTSVCSQPHRSWLQKSVSTWLTELVRTVLTGVFSEGSCESWSYHVCCRKTIHSFYFSAYLPTA